MRKTKINKNEFLSKLIEISELFFLDFLIELYSFDSIKRLCNKFNLTDSRNDKDQIYDFYIVIYHSIFKNNNISLLNAIIKDNDFAIERNIFHKMTFEELKFDYSKKMTYHESLKASPELIIFYYYSKFAFNNDICINSIDFYHQKTNEDEKIWNNPSLKEVGEILKSFREKLEIIQREELELFLKEDYNIEEKQSFINKIIQDFECSYEKEKKVFNNFNEGLIFWIANKITKFDKERESLEACVNTAYNMCKQAYKNIEVTNKAMKQFSKLKEKIRDLEIKNKKLKKDSTSMKSIQKIKTKDNKDLEKENYYLKSEIEKLKERISILEEEEQIKKEIEEFIKVEEVEKTKEVPVPQMADIIILGGKWNSNNSQLIENFFWENGNSEVEFLEADKLIRNEYKIKNADVVIFDTSLNSHKMFYKYRKNIDFIISKSNLDEIKNKFN